MLRIPGVQPCTFSTADHSGPGGLVPADLSATAAIRMDAKVSVREEITFFGPGPDFLFGLRHLPLGQEPQGGVVITSPYDTEIPATYRWEVLLGRHLAARGFAVQRFHYRGMGNSDGDVSKLTFATMVEDALTAAAELRQGSPDRLAFAGAGLGAMVAAAACMRLRSACLILRGPQFDGNSYLRQTLRAQIVASMREGTSGEQPTVGRLREALDAQGSIDVCGHTLTREFYESVSERTIEAELGPHPRPVLLLQGNPSGTLTADAEGFVAALNDSGFPVDTAVVPRLETFWLLGSEFRPVDDLPELHDQLTTISDWLAVQLQA